MVRYAIVRTGGKQYRVEEGRTIDVERLPAPQGERIELKDVLLLNDGSSVSVGTPTVPDARVVAEVVSHGRGPKITVFRYKAKVRHRKKTGHRQAFTRLAIQRIQVGEEEKAEKKPAARRKAKATRAKAEAAPKPTTARRRGRAAPKAEAAAAKEPAASPARRRRRKPQTEP